MVGFSAGCHENDVEPDVQAFLQYVDGVLIENEFVHEINEEVTRVRQHKEWKVSYMTLAMELERQKKEGLEQGIEKGVVAEKMNTVIEMLKEKCEYGFIAKITKLSVERIEEIAKENNLV